MTSTTPERRSAKAVFTAAMSVSDPAERHAYVDAQCANDTALRQQVAGLLAAAEASVGDNPLDAMVEALGPESTANAATVLPTPRDVSQRREIGRYKLLEQIGEGAFGTV